MLRICSLSYSLLRPQLRGWLFLSNYYETASFPPHKGRAPRQLSCACFCPPQHSEPFGVCTHRTVSPQQIYLLRMMSTRKPFPNTGFWASSHSSPHARELGISKMTIMPVGSCPPCTSFPGGPSDGHTDITSLSPHLFLFCWTLFVLGCPYRCFLSFCL